MFGFWMKVDEYMSGIKMTWRVCQGPRVTVHVGKEKYQIIALKNNYTWFSEGPPGGHIFMATSVFNFLVAY